MPEKPAISAAATVTMTATVALPPGWTQTPNAAEELYAAAAPGASLCVYYRELTDPRTQIPEQVRAAAGDDAAQVYTSYLELPAGRAILAGIDVHANGRGAVQLWLPLPGGADALVLVIVADAPAWTPDAAAVVTEIGRRLELDRSTSVTLRTNAATSGAPAVAA